MKFILDNHLPIRLAQYLRSKGHEAEHVIDPSLGLRQDESIWEHAIKMGLVVVSKDEDFIRLSGRTGDFGRLWWIRVGNCRNPVLIAKVSAALDDACKAFESGQRVVELE